MKKKIVLSSIATLALISLVGCGGGNSTSEGGVTQSATTGTGYYVDSAVKGVKYICGTQTGTTDEKGKFTFEEGKACTFSLAGIKLRTTPAEELVDGKNIVENDPKVAKFLQSIDSNNDLTDGIQISDQVLDALTNALNENNSVGILPEDTALVDVVASVAHDVPSVSADVRTDAEVTEHLTQTQTEITKELLAGKTFYHVVVKSDGSVGSLEKGVVNATATVMTYSCIDGCKDNQGGTANFAVVGKSIVFENGEKATLTKQTSDYVLFEDSYGKDYLYSSEAKAKAYYDSLATPSSTTATPSTLSDLIVGKTYYVTVNDSYTDENGDTVQNDHVETLAFGTDGKVHDTWVENGAQQETIMDYSIDGDTLSIVTPNDVTVTFTNAEELSTHIRFTDANGEESGRFFLTYADAEATIDSGSSTTTPSSTTPSTLSDLIVGKTFYITVHDSYTDENGDTVQNDHVETLVFATDGKMHDTWVENGAQQETIMDYSIDGDTLSIVTPNDVTMTFINFEQTATALTFTDPNANVNGNDVDRFFFDEATARAAL